MLIDYEEDELVAMYLIRNANAKIKEAQQTKHNVQERCPHRHLNAEHERIDGYGERSIFRTHFRCLVCSKQWSVNGSK